jgi:hypothetical protein
LKNLGEIRRRSQFGAKGEPFTCYDDLFKTLTFNSAGSISVFGKSYGIVQLHSYTIVESWDQFGEILVWLTSSTQICLCGLRSLNSAPFAEDLAD